MATYANVNQVLPNIDASGQDTVPNQALNDVVGWNPYQGGTAYGAEAVNGPSSTGLNSTVQNLLNQSDAAQTAANTPSSAPDQANYGLANQALGGLSTAGSFAGSTADNANINYLKNLQNVSNYGNPAAQAQLTANTQAGNASALSRAASLEGDAGSRAAAMLDARQQADRNSAASTANGAILSAQGQQAATAQMPAAYGTIGSLYNTNASAAATGANNAIGQQAFNLAQQGNYQGMMGNAALDYTNMNSGLQNSEQQINDQNYTNWIKNANAATGLNTSQNMIDFNNVFTPLTATMQAVSNVGSTAGAGNKGGV